MPEGQRVGSGKKSDGGFCSLDCYGEYHKKRLVEKHKNLRDEEQRRNN
jgi:hypothetical protein